MFDVIPFEDAPTAQECTDWADAIDAAIPRLRDDIEAEILRRIPEPPNTTPAGLMCIRALPASARMGVML